MSFDAGSIIARAEVNQDKFSRDLDAMEARAKRFENARHEVRFKVSVADSDLQRARQQFARFDQQIYTDAVQRQRSGRGILAGLFGRVAPSGASGATLFGGLVGSGGSSSSASTEAAVRGEMARLDSALARDSARRTAKPASGGGFLSSLLGGIGPAIPGVGLRSAGILGLGAPLAGALPALIGGAAALGIGGIGAGVIGLGAKTLIGTRNVAGQPATQGPLFAAAQQAKTALTTAFQSAAIGMEAPLRKVFGEIPKLMKGLAGPLHQLFAGAGTLIEPIVHGLSDMARTVLPLLGTAFRAVAPLLRPFLDGLAGLLKGVLSGLIPLLKAVKPAVDVLRSALVLIGHDLGSMFKDFAPVVKASSVILKSLLAVVAALFPIIGKLAAIFATILAPVFKVFAGVIKALLPTLTIVGKVIGELAAAVLGDLSAAFGALAKLLIDITPSLNILASVLGQVFKTLENTGVFAILGNGIEAVVKPLAALINALIRGLAPVLPKIVGLISSLSGQAIRVLVTALQILLPIMTQLVRDVLPPLVTVLNALMPAINAVARILASGLEAVLKTIAPLLSKLAPYILAVYAAVKLWIVAQGILDGLLAANPVGLIVIAVAALAVGIAILAQHWHTVWTNIKNWALDAWHAIDNDVIHPLMRAFDAVRVFMEEWALRLEIVFAGWAKNILHYAQDAFGWLPSWIPGVSGIQNGLAAAHRDLASFVSGAQASLAKLTGHDYPIKFTVKLPPGAVTNTPGAKSGGAPTRPGMAAGSPRGGAPPGWAWVGERGPELMSFSGGETVLPSHVSMAVSRGFAAGTGTVTVDLSMPSLAAMSAVLGSTVHSVVSSIQSRYSVPGHYLGGGGLGGVPGGIPPSGPIQSYARKLVSAIWPGLGNWLAFADIVSRESGWNTFAENPSSGAYGIPQALPGSKMASAGADWRTNPFTQIRWMVGYILDRWRTPLAADFNELHAHWYDGGGWLLPGASVAMNQTGMREAVITPAQSHAFTMLARAAEGVMGKDSSGASRRQLAETVNIMLPEGATVAQAMNELLLRMQIAEMQGFAGIS